MKNIEKVVIPVIIIVIITMLGIYYISKEYEKRQSEKRAEQMAEEEAEQSGEDLVDPDELLYETMAMLVGKNEEEGTLKFLAIDNDRLFELEYTGSTPILGRYGDMLTIDQIMLGEILDVSYSLHNKELVSLRISSDAWTFTDVTRFTINEEEHRMDIAGSTYKLPKTSIVSYGNELASFMDVTNVDTLTVKGYGRRVCSIIVQRGHGYVRLQNDSYFEGGWIEIGQEIIKTVTEEMLIPVPEGSYHVRLTNKGYAADEDIIVERDKETLIDLSEVDIKEVAIGHVAFSILPDFAQLYIDGEMTDYDERIALEFGIHRIHVECAGYRNVDTNIRVSDKYANVDITLEKEGENTSSSSTAKTTAKTPTATPTATVTPAPSTTNMIDGNVIAPLRNAPTPTPYHGDSSSSTTATGTTSATDGSSSTAAGIISDTQKMYIECPEESEVYIDGIYVGIAPVTFVKPSAGSHVITLSRNGYITKSYTVYVYGDDRDVTLSFSDLVEDHTDDHKDDHKDDHDDDHDDDEDD
ncbi:MAG: PEGA domain-containing protein [Lachnospiraceae bacterium]|nr:PEGA domain-containing protein [Lachnospiraceae bacterium]